MEEQVLAEITPKVSSMKESKRKETAFIFCMRKSWARLHFLVAVSKSI